MPFSIYQVAAWSVIVGLSLMVVGGLMLWAYGARQGERGALAGGPEAEATHRFHQRLARWFFIYGMIVIALGGSLLFWGGSYFV